MNCKELLVSIVRVCEHMPLAIMHGEALLVMVQARWRAFLSASSLAFHVALTSKSKLRAMRITLNHSHENVGPKFKTMTFTPCFALHLIVICVVIRHV